jgi:hypothetical protein
MASQPGPSLQDSSRKPGSGRALLLAVLLAFLAGGALVGWAGVLVLGRDVPVYAVVPEPSHAQTRTYNQHIVQDVSLNDAH